MILTDTIYDMELETCPKKESRRAPFMIPRPLYNSNYRIIGSNRHHTVVPWEAEAVLLLC